MEDLADIIYQNAGGYGARPDGTAKGEGWMGPLTTKSGDTMTELTASSDVDGKAIQYPLVTPNQGFKNLSWLLQGNTPTAEIYQKAIQHALSQLYSGRSAYAPEFAAPAKEK